MNGHPTAGGSCGTCIIDVLQGADHLSARSELEAKKLKGKPASFRLACQTVCEGRGDECVALAATQRALSVTQRALGVTPLVARMAWVCTHRANRDAGTRWQEAEHPDDAQVELRSMRAVAVLRGRPCGCEPLLVQERS